MLLTVGQKRNKEGVPLGGVSNISIVSTTLGSFNRNTPRHCNCFRRLQCS